MLYHPLSVFSVLASWLLNGLAATPLEPRFDGVRTKHAWGAVPEHWETLGHPPTGTVTTIDLHIALESQCRNALIDTLYEFSVPRSQKYVLFATPRRTHIPTYASSPSYIWCTPVQGADR